MCVALLVEHVGEVRREAALGEAHEEAVREAVALEAVERLQFVGPLLRKRDPVATDDLVAGRGACSRANFEAGGEDEAIDLVLGVVDDDRVLGDTLDAAALSCRRASRSGG